jgi:hypothetical protein
MYQHEKEPLMDPIKKAVTGTIVSLMGLILLLLASAAPCRAQAETPPSAQHLIGVGGVNPTTASDSVATNQSTAPDPAAPASGQAGQSADDDAWHLAASPYLWFPGIHGVVGVGDRTVGVHATTIDVLSNFRFGFMGAVEARRKRLLLSLDMMWVRLGDDKALPFPNLGASSADIKISQFVLTPKVGVRLLDREKFKVDALAGFRYWHFGENVEFTPSNLNLNFSSSQNWVDPIVGGRIQLPLTSKLAVSILGDVGGWGTGSQLEYQVGGFLGYRIKPKWNLQVGYRYLDVNYRSSRAIIDTAISGVAVGVVVNLK